MHTSGFWQSYGNASLLQALDQCISGLPQVPQRLAVALSGGADSAMLAVHAAIYAHRHAKELHFLHIHHGLQTPADHWQAHVHDLAQALRVPCHSLVVTVAASSGAGIESAARDARYEGLDQLANRLDLHHILLAHHRNDQAETVLLRLLRGSGPTGLAAMMPVTKRQDVAYLRPWLAMDRALILEEAQRYAAFGGWAPVQDPTNADDRYTRAAVRERLVPALDERWPGWRGNVVRHARQSAEMKEILDEVAQGDFAGLSPGMDARSFSLAAWRALSPARQALVLRHWLGINGQRMPTDARLQDVMRQLRQLHALGHDRHMQVRHGDAWIRCIKGRVLLDKDTPARDGAEPCARNTVK
jgi:tRNA(Ile)-lysidine synthase